METFGGLDILHNNAFGQPPLPAGRSRLAFTGDIEEDVWGHVINLGLTAVFRATQRAIPELLKRGGGAIVNTASTPGFSRTSPSAPTTAKAGVINLTRVTAIGYAGRGHSRELRLSRSHRHAASQAVALDPRLRRGHARADSHATSRPAGRDGECRYVPGLGSCVLRHGRRCRRGRRADRPDGSAFTDSATVTVV